MSSSRVYVITCPNRDVYTQLPTPGRLESMANDLGAGMTSLGRVPGRGWVVRLTPYDGDKSRLTRAIKAECAVRGWSVDLP